jgi:hypothetical protein
MAFDITVKHYEATHAGSKKQSREVSALMGLPEDSFLMENVDVTAFHDGRAIATVQISKVLTAEEWLALRQILHIEPILTSEPPAR